MRFCIRYAGTINPLNMLHVFNLCVTQYRKGTYILVYTCLWVHSTNSKYCNDTFPLNLYMWVTSQKSTQVECTLYASAYAFSNIINTGVAVMCNMCKL